jgi:hypothetical protein
MQQQKCSALCESRATSLKICILVAFAANVQSQRVLGARVAGGPNGEQDAAVIGEIRLEDFRLLGKDPVYQYWK